MKFLKLMFSGFFLFFLVRCQVNSSETKSTLKQVKKVEKKFLYDQNKEVYEIINCTLKRLIPENKAAYSTLLFHHQLVVADIELINDFVKIGGNELLYKLNHNFIQPRGISTIKLKDFGNVHILETFPLTTDELNKHIGGVIYSRIVFNKEKTEAAFIVDFSHLHQKEGRVFCAVHMVKSKNCWKIASKVCLENSSSMLIE